MDNFQPPSYDFKSIYNRIQQKPNQRFNLPEYKSDLLIKNVQGKGRGLFSNKDIQTGELIIANKAFEILFPQEFDQNLSQNEKFMIPLKNIEQKLSNDVQKSMEFQNLHAGPTFQSLQKNDKKLKDIDFQRLMYICLYNMFGVGDDKNQQHLGAGVWILPSYINHSCIDRNCYFQILGDFIFIRANQSIKSGEELKINYISPFKNIEKRQQKFKHYGFECDCRLCVHQRDQKNDIQQKFQKQLDQNHNKIINQYEIFKKIEFKTFNELDLISYQEPLAQITENLKKNNYIKESIDVQLQNYEIIQLTKNPLMIIELCLNLALDYKYIQDIEQENFWQCNAKCESQKFFLDENILQFIFRDLYNKLIC